MAGEVVGVYAGSQLVAVDAGGRSLALSREYYDAVKSYFQLVRESFDGERECRASLSEVVEGVRSIAVPLFCGRGGELCSGVRDVLRVGAGVESVAEVCKRLEDVEFRVGGEDENGVKSSGVVGTSVGLETLDGRQGGGVDEARKDCCESSRSGQFGEAVSSCGDLISSGVGRQHAKNVRKRERAKAKRLVAVAGVGGGCSVDAASESSSRVVKGVSYASVASRPVNSGLKSGGESSGFVRADLEDVVSSDERRVLARDWYERKRVENKLAIQRANYNIKRNEYLDRARISEKKWEQERLSCEQKLARITEARFGSKPGYAETLASISDGSELPPSLSTGGDSPANLSDGTISPGSSMSVAEENRLKKKVEDLAGEVAQLKLERVALNAACKFSGGKAVVEGGRVHVYDGSGQYVPPTPVYGSECELYSMGDYPEELQYC